MSAAPLHQLISIPASHYCERARWALDLVGIPFAEFGWPPMLHYQGTMPNGGKSVPVLVAPRGDAAAAAAAADAVMDVDARHSALNKAAAGDQGKAEGKQRSPPKPGVLADSADIVQYAHLRYMAQQQSQRAQAPPAGGGAADGGGAGSSGAAAAAAAGGGDDGDGDGGSPLYPSDPAQLNEVHELEELFSRKLGVWSRVIAYQWLFQDKGMALDTLGLRQTATMSGWKLVALRFVFPIIRTGVSKGLRVNAESAARALERTQQLFQEVEARLARPGSGGYLVGGRFTAADLAFAAMVGPVLCPSQYGAYLPPAQAWPADFPMHELRRTPAGQYAMRMYEQHRKPQPQPAAAPASEPAGSSQQSRL